MIVGGLELDDTEARIALRADHLVMLMADAIAAAMPHDDLAAACLRDIERSIPETPARLWVAVAGLDLLMEGKVAKVMEATIGLVAGGMAVFDSMAQVLAMFTDHFAGEIQARTLN